MRERIQEVSINGRKLTSGMEISLPRTAGRRAGRYRFDWAEVTDDGSTILSVYGPIRAKGAIPHYRLANAAVVKTVHSKTKD